MNSGALSRVNSGALSRVISGVVHGDVWCGGAVWSVVWWRRGAVWWCRLVCGVVVTCGQWCGGDVPCGGDV